MSLLKVDNLGKAFRSYRSEWLRFARWFGLPTKPSEEHWVLRHINFDVHPGEAIGIIGKNGAGKSTLLKMITGTMQPSEGQIEVNGRIAAILELGMAFNLELTGRQNVLHTAGLMGSSTEQAQQAIPDIEAFADIGEYFDQPVRVYSSGMQARIAFAVASADRPDILIIDEALSVGDASFQRKCFHRIEKYMNDGMSLLLVSHDVESIKKLCTKALFLKDYSQQFFGDAKVACDEYEQYLFGCNGIQPKHTDQGSIRQEHSPALIDPSLLTVNELSYGGSRATIEEVWLENSLGQHANILNMGDNFTLKYKVLIHSSVKSPVFAFLIKTLEGISLYGSDTQSLGNETEEYEPGDSVEIKFNLKNNLSAGTYFINCGVRDNSFEESVFIHRRVDVAMFKVAQHTDTNQVGLVNLAAKFSTVKSNNQIAGSIAK